MTTKDDQKESRFRRRQRADGMRLRRLYCSVCDAEVEPVIEFDMTAEYLCPTCMSGEFISLEVIASGTAAVPPVIEPTSFEETSDGNAPAH